MRVLTLSMVSENKPVPALADHVEALAIDHGVDFDHLAVSVGGPRAYGRALAAQLRMILPRCPYDLIHAFYGYCGLIGRLQFQAPLLVTFQGSDLLGGIDGAMHGRDGRVGRAVARVTDGLIVMSDEMRRASGRDDAEVIPFGVNTEVFSPQPRAHARLALGLDPDEQLVLFPYDPIRPEKNHAMAEAAVARLRGGGRSVRLLPVHSRPREDLAIFMNACDAMVMVSDHEGSPMAVREALACNLPVVSTDVGDVRQVLDPFPGCAVVAPTVDAVADALAGVLASGQRVDSSVAVSKLDVTTAAADIFAVYQRLVGHDVADRTRRETSRSEPCVA